MWIERIYVQRFGCLQDYLLESPDRLTFILGRNGAGKSTLMDFIFAVLYGLGGRGRSAETNARLRYLPWGETDMRGSLDIQVEGLTYRIERSFGSKKSEDTCKVWILETGEEFFPTHPDQPGFDITGISAPLFLNTAFVRADQLRPDVSKDQAGQLEDALMGEATVAAGEGKTLRQVQSDLANQVNAILSPSGKKGELAEARQALQKEEANWAAELKAADQQSATEEELKAVGQRLVSAGNYLHELEAQVEGAELVENLLAARQEIEESSAEHPSEEELPYLEDEEDQPLPFGLFAGGLLLMGLGAAAGYFIHPAFYLLAGVGIAVFIQAFAVRARNRRQQQMDEEPSEEVHFYYNHLLEKLAQWQAKTGLSPDSPVLAPGQLSVLQERYQNQRALHTEIQRQADRLTGRLEVLRQNSETGSPKQAEENVKTARKRCADLEYRLAVLQETEQRIQEAANSFRRQTGPELLSALEYWLPQLTGGQVTAGLVNRELQLQVSTLVPNAPAFVGADYLSTATAAQSYVALRLALLEILSDKPGTGEAVGYLPLLLDAPFAGWDEERQQAAITVLMAFAERSRRQLFLFTESSRLTALAYGQNPSIEVIIL